MRCIQVGDKPLLVRAEAGLGSDVIGRLLPGRMMTVVEERIDPPSGYVRACVVLNLPLMAP